MPGQIDEELQEFHRFLSDSLSAGAMDWSAEEALDTWRQLHPETQAYEDETAAIREALGDMANGDRGTPFDEFARDFRKRHSLPAQP